MRLINLPFAALAKFRFPGSCVASIGAKSGQIYFQEAQDVSTAVLFALASTCATSWPHDTALYLGAPSALMTSLSRLSCHRCVSTTCARRNVLSTEELD